MAYRTIVEELRLRRPLPAPLEKLDFIDLQALASSGFPAIETFPVSIKILLEGLLRNEDGAEIRREHVEALLRYDPAHPKPRELPFKPARILLQDFTGIPCLVDLAAMRSALSRMGGDPSRINPGIPVDLVVDHSVQVDFYGDPEALRRNEALEFQRNGERYAFIRWGQKTFKNFSVVPPGFGICHQINMEYLAKVVATDVAKGVAADAGVGAKGNLAYFDTLVGTDSHTPMINGLGVLGWGVGGIEAEAAMLGYALPLQAPAVVGVELTGTLRAGVTATDAVLTLTELLRRHGTVDKFVEFHGTGLSSVPAEDRATLANMAAEYGATMGFFPVDERTLEYLRNTGRSDEQVELVRGYALAQGTFRRELSPRPLFAEQLHLDLSQVEPCIAGPKRPQDRIPLSRSASEWKRSLGAPVKEGGLQVAQDELKRRSDFTFTDSRGKAQTGSLTHGDVVIAAITSCTNTSNPRVMLAAGLVAKKAVERGLRVKAQVKTSLAPGSRVVTDYLRRAGLLGYLETLGFHLVGYGCTTCIGNSGPLPDGLAQAIKNADLTVAAVLSGNRNFEGRIHPLTKANYLASPPLVVAYALAGTMAVDFAAEALGRDPQGRDVFLRDLWPSGAELAEAEAGALDSRVFTATYRDPGSSNLLWNRLPAGESELYAWQAGSSYIQEPDYFSGMDTTSVAAAPILGARCLVRAGDSVTTDHISPAGDIDKESPAGRYLLSLGIAAADFNSYGSRRGNDRVMVRGTFANLRFRNLLCPGKTGSWTVHHPSGREMDIHSAAEEYRKSGTPLIILAGKDYGMGSSRDWAAKGPYLLGVKAVIAESYERIHRSNLVGMGILPLQFAPGTDCGTLGLRGTETFSIALDGSLRPGGVLMVVAVGGAGTADTRDAADSGGKPGGDGRETIFKVICRIDNPAEMEYYLGGGILRRVVRKSLE